MAQLNRSMLQRFQRLASAPGPWEGARRSIGQDFGQEEEAVSMDCILWVDALQGEVRSLAMVPSDTGQEPLVRTLLQAMEAPQGSQAPARPRKVVVSDRQAQFYLRGALQGLEIEVEYAAKLPLIDALFEAMAAGGEDPGPQIPEPYGPALIEQAMAIWEVAPWNVLNEQQILAVEVNAWEVETLYVSVLGMAGVDYGLLMYRSQDSLLKFRQQVLTNERSPKLLQEAFLEQDCLYLNFELIGESDGPAGLPELRWLNPTPEAVEPDFGSLHPLEGMRTQLVEEEVFTLMVALGALERFFERHYDQLDQAKFPSLEGSYRLPNPDPSCDRKTQSVQVKTLPELAARVEQETERALAAPIGDLPFPALRDDYVPEGAIITLTKVPAAWLEDLYHAPTSHYHGSSPPPPSELPVLVIQTSRPKAKTLIQQLRAVDGLKSICFNSGYDSFNREEFRLGLLHTANDEFHLFGEYQLSIPQDKKALERWCGWLEDSPHCGVVIAYGVTGKSKGSPGPQHLLGFFPAQLRDAQELGLPPLHLQFAMDWELE